jgi:hypothetical protein
VPVEMLKRALLPSIALLPLESVSFASVVTACARGDSTKQAHTIVIKTVGIILLQSMFEFFISISPLVRVLTKWRGQVPDYFWKNWGAHAPGSASAGFAAPSPQISFRRNRESVRRGADRCTRWRVRSPNWLRSGRCTFYPDALRRSRSCILACKKRKKAAAFFP